MFACVGVDAAFSERTRLCRKGSVCMCRGGCDFVGKDTALSEMTQICQRAYGSVAFGEDATLSERKWFF